MAQPPASSMPPMQTIQPRSTTPVAPSAPTPLAPLKTQLAVDKNDQPLSSPAYNTPLSGGQMSADPMSGQNSANGRYFPNNGPLYQTRPANAVKRSYGESFGEQPDEPLRQGARPMNPPARPILENGIDDSDDYEPPMERNAMSYRRADGTERRRTMPTL